MQIVYRTSPPIGDKELNQLFAAASEEHSERAFGPILERSFVYICAFQNGRLVGFVNVAWDGGAHGFLLDPTVSPELRRRGIGTELVRRAAEAAATAGLEWLHVDYERHLEPFYRRCGFRRTSAGLMRLSPAQRPRSTPPLS